MWQYEIDNDNQRVYIKPLIEDLTIDSVVINGKVASCGNSVYKLENTADLTAVNDNADIDVVVNYTLHGRQTMSTHYTPEFNSGIKRTSIDDFVSGIEEIPCFEEGKIVKIYTTMGVLVFDGKYNDANLDRGIYIIVSQDRIFKQLIK